MANDYTLRLQFFEGKREKYEPLNQLKKIKYWKALEPGASQLDGEAIGNSLFGREMEYIILQYLKKLEVPVKNASGEAKTYLWHGEKWVGPAKIKTGDSSATNTLELLVGFLDNEILEEPQLFDRLIDDQRLRKTTDPYSRRYKGNFIPRPMIFIGVDDLMQWSDPNKRHKSIESEDYVSKIHQRIDPRFRILDSSIWNRYVSISPVNNASSIKGFRERFIETVKDILTYYHQGLYRSIVAQEYLEFQCRKFQQSYVKNYPGGHAKKVTPFRFHSESRMKVLADEKMRQLNGYTWSCLLVDDYALKGLRTAEQEANVISNEIISKGAWIQQLINKDGNEFIKLLNADDLRVKKEFNSQTGLLEKDNRPTEGFVNYFIKQLETLSEIEHVRPDIFILDYFFGVDESNPDQQYGHKFLRQLEILRGNAEFESHQVAPTEEVDNNLSQITSLPSKTTAFGKYRIFPISAFEHAFRSHLRLMGASAGHEYIEIGDGADPINSPELFRYLMYCFLENQHKGLRIEIKDLAERLCKGIDEKEIGDLKTRLAENYTPFVGMVSKYWALDKEKDRSTFAQSYLQKLNRTRQLDSVVTHLQTLVGLIAHGSIWDWPRMWQEYQILEDLKLHVGKLHKTLADQLIPDVLLDAMKKYIIRLKKIAS